MGEPGIGQAGRVNELIRAVEAKMRAKAGVLASAHSGEIRFRNVGNEVEIEITTRHR